MVRKEKQIPICRRASRAKMQDMCGTKTDLQQL